MKKKEILEEYNLYSAQIILYKTEEINDSILKDIPIVWHDIVRERNTKKRLYNTIMMWQVILPNELSNTITYLSENLCDVDLIRIDDRFYLLYTIRSMGEKLLYYVGGNPMDSNIEQSKPYLDGYMFDETLKKFYTKLHNGFYDYCSGSMGIIECQEIECLAEYEWGILEEIGDSLLIGLEDTYTFFYNGMGDYVAIDLKKNKDVIWFHDQEPIYDNLFWDVVDEWVKIGMSE